MRIRLGQGRGYILQKGVPNMRKEAKRECTNNVGSAIKERVQKGKVSGKGLGSGRGGMSESVGTPTRRRIVGVPLT